MPEDGEGLFKEVDKIMDDIIDRIFQLSQERLIEDKKIDTGTLMKTANVNRRFLEKEIVYHTLYAEFVEFGRNPGQMPPPAALQKWVRRKLGIANEKENKRVSWAIAKAIKERGIAPSPFLRPALERTVQEFTK